MASLNSLLNPESSYESSLRLQAVRSPSSTTNSPTEQTSESSNTAVELRAPPRAEVVIRAHEPHPDCPDTLACLPDTDGRPQHTLPVILRCTILGSPRKRLTIREIYAAMERKYPYYKTAGPAWKQSVRHHLSLNRLFERQPRPPSDPGFGSYWTVNLDAPPGTKRPRKRGGRTNKNDGPDIVMHGLGPLPHAIIPMHVHPMPFPALPGPPVLQPPPSATPSTTSTLMSPSPNTASSSSGVTSASARPPHPHAMGQPSPHEERLHPGLSPSNPQSHPQHIPRESYYRSYSPPLPQHAHLHVQSPHTQPPPPPQAQQPPSHTHSQPPPHHHTHPHPHHVPPPHAHSMPPHSQPSHAQPPPHPQPPPPSQPPPHPHHPSPHPHPHSQAQPPPSHYAHVPHTNSHSHPNPPPPPPPQHVHAHSPHTHSPHAHSPHAHSQPPPHPHSHHHTHPHPHHPHQHPHQHPSPNANSQPPQPVPTIAKLRPVDSRSFSQTTTNRNRNLYDEDDDDEMDWEDDPDGPQYSDDDYSSSEDMPYKYDPRSHHRGPNSYSGSSHRSYSGSQGQGGRSVLHGAFSSYSADQADSTIERLKMEMAGLRRQSQDAVNASLRLSDQLNASQEEAKRAKAALKVAENMLEEETRRRLQAETTADEEARRRRAAEEALRQFQAQAQQRKPASYSRP